MCLRSLSGDSEPAAVHILDLGSSFPGDKLAVRAAASTSPGGRTGMNDL